MAYYLDILVGVYNGPHFNGSLLQWIEVDQAEWEDTSFGGCGSATFRARYQLEELATTTTNFQQTLNLNAGNRMVVYARNDVTTSTSSTYSVVVANPTRFKVGQGVALWDGNNVNTSIITAISGSTLTLGTALTNSFAGNTNVLVLRWSGLCSAVTRDATLEKYSTVEAVGYQTELANYITTFNGGGMEAGWCAYQLVNSYSSQWDLVPQTLNSTNWVGTTTGAVSGVSGGTGQGYFGSQTNSTVAACLQDIITYANASSSSNANYTIWIDPFGAVYFTQINSTTPTCTVNVSLPTQPGGASGFTADGIFNMVGTLTLRDQDITQICNSVLVQGGSDGAGGQVTAIVVDQASINVYGTYQDTISETGLTTQAACAAYGQAYLNQYAFPRQTSDVDFSIAGSFLTAQDYIQINGLATAENTPLLTNIQTVKTQWSSEAQGQFTQTVTGQQLYPDVKQLIQEFSSQKYAALASLGDGSTNVRDRFCASGLNASYSGSTFTVAAGTLGCLILNVGLDVFSVPTLTYTPSTDGTYTVAWLYRNTNGSLYSSPGWVEFVGSTVPASASYTPYQIVPLYTICRYGGKIISFNDLRQFGGVNLANLQSAVYPAPTLGIGGATISLQSVGVSGISSEVVVTAVLNNVPQDYGVTRVAFLKRNASASAWEVEAEVPLTPFPLPSQSQTVSYGYGGLINGTSYVFGVAYVNYSGQINLASGVLTLTTSTYTSGVVQCNPVQIGAPYQLGGVSITPTFSTVSITPASSYNGVSAATAVSFICTNQPTDGSLSRINVFYQVGSSGWIFYGSQAAVNVGQTAPSATGSYSLTLELTNGITYAIGATYENTQGGDSNVGTIASAFTAATVQIGSNGLQQMPSAIKTNGPSVTVLSDYSGGASTYYGLSGQNGGSDEVQFTVNLGDTITGSTGQWYQGTLLTYRLHGTSNYAGFTDTNLNASTSNVVMTVGGLGAGKAYDIGLAYKDTSGVNSTIVWPSALSNISTAQAGAGAILGSANQNLVPDSGLDFAPYNSSGIAGSDSGYWHFQLIDGTSYYLLRPAANTSNSAAANVMWWASGSSGQNRYGVSNTIYVTPGQTYCFSSTCDASQLSSGSNKPGLIIALPSTPSNTYGTVIATVNQTLGTAGHIYSTFVAPSGGKVVIVASSNSCTIASGKWFNMAQFQIELGTSFTGYKPGVAVLPTGVITHTASSAETQSVISTTSTAGAGQLNVLPAGGTTGVLPLVNHAGQVTSTITNTAGSDGSYINNGFISARHMYGGNASDSGAMVDSTSKLLYARHATPLTTTISNTAGVEGSYINSSQISRRHLSDISNTNKLFNPTFNQGLYGWTTASTATNSTAFASAFKGGRLCINMSSSDSSPKYLVVSQQLNTTNANLLYNAFQYVVSGFIEIDGSTSGQAVVDVYDVTAATTLASTGYVGYTAGVRTPFTVPFTYNNSTDIIIRCYCNANGSAFQAYYYALKVEEGSIPTLYGDDYSAGLTTYTHDYLGRINAGQVSQPGTTVPYANHAGALTTVVNSAGTYNANLATGQLPFANHNQTIINNTSITVSCAGQMPYMSGTTLHIPTKLIIFRSDGSYCRTGPGTASLGTNTGFGAWYMVWTSGGTGASLGYVDYNTSLYQQVLTNPTYQVFGYMQQDSGSNYFFANWVNSQHFSAVQGSIDVNGHTIGSTLLYNQLSINSYTTATVSVTTSTNSSNACTINASWSTFSVMRADGSSISVGAGSTGNLSGYGSTTYYMYFWFSPTQNTSYSNVAVTGGYMMFSFPTTRQTVGSSAYLQAMQQDGAVSVVVGSSFTTPVAPASGNPPTGGSGGGNPPSCPATWQLVETQERGFVRSDELSVGMHLKDCDGWNEIYALETREDTIVEVSTDNETFAVEIGHLWLRAGGDADGRSDDWVPTNELTLGTLVTAYDNGKPIAVAITGLSVWGQGTYVRVVCENNRFILGRTLAHNFTTY